MAHDHFTFVLTLKDFPAQTLAWYKRAVFEGTMAFKDRLAARVLKVTTDNDAWYIAAKEHAKSKLQYACDTLTVTAVDQTTTKLSFGFKFDGNTAVSEDGRMLWLRSDFEDLVWRPVTMAVLDKTMDMYLPGMTDEERAEAALFDMLRTAFDTCMNSGNDLDSPTFHIVEEHAHTPAVSTNLDL